MLGLKGYLISAIVTAIVAGIATHALDANHYNTVIARDAATYAGNMKAVSDTAAAAAARNLQALQDELDKTKADSELAYQELLDVQADYTVLRNSIAGGTRRLSIAAQCPAGGGGVSPAGTPGGLVHGAERAELNAADSETLLTIANDGDQAAVKLKACQDYVRDITGRK